MEDASWGSTRATALDPSIWIGALLVATPFLPGVLGHLGWTHAAEVLDQAWAPLCHRIPERCLDFLGAPMPMCSRCFGLVIGLGAGLVVKRPHLPPRRLLAVVGVAALAMALELVTQEFGLHRVFHATRLLSGLLLAYPIGAAAGALAAETPAIRSVPKNRRG